LNSAQKLLVKIEDIMNELEKEIEAKKFPYKVSKACVFCKNANHTSNYCRTVVGMNERRDILKKEQLCWKCFADSHKRSECSKKNCSCCKQMHDVSVCSPMVPCKKGTVPMTPTSQVLDSSLGTTSYYIKRAKCVC
uniref:Nucleic-acid-binding protein from transposon X-element n=1 Tax=Haemonchus placei TaxID=6290 RepID=A0A0N4W4M4_HAEPC